MFQYVQPFLSKLVWKGSAVGMRLRLEPTSDVASLKELAWAYNLARQPVKGMSSESLAWSIDLLCPLHYQRGSQTRVVKGIDCD